MRVAVIVMRAWAVLAWVAMILVAAALMLICLPFLRAPKRKHFDPLIRLDEDFKPLPPGPPGTLFGLPVVEVDAVPEGLGATRPSPHALVPRHTVHLAYLPQDEWQLWTSVIQESAR